MPRALIGGVTFVVLLYLAAGSRDPDAASRRCRRRLPRALRRCPGVAVGQGAATFAAVTIAVAAVGCLNGLILATGELGYSMALRGDMPKAMAWTRGVNTPVVAQVVGSLLSALVLLANNSKATASLYHLRHPARTASVVIVYLVGTLSAWKNSPRLGQRAAPRLRLPVHRFRDLRHRAGSRCCGPGAARDRAWRSAAVMHRLNARAGSSPPAAETSSRASGISRRSFAREAAQADFARPQRPGLVGRAFHAVLDPGDQLGVLGIDPAVDPPVEVRAAFISRRSSGSA